MKMIGKTRELLVKMIDKTREIFVKMMSLHMNDNRNFYTYSCIDAMINEQEVHRRLYPMRIHPRSRFRIFWETFYVGYMSISVIIYFIFATIDRFEPITTIAAYLCCMFAEMPLIANIFFNFITGFYHNKRPEAIMKFSAIWRHHVKTTLMFDLFGLVVGSPFIVYLAIFDPEIMFLGDINLTARAVGILMRLVSPWYYLKNIRAYYIMDGVSYKILEFVVFLPVFVSFITCMSIANRHNFTNYFDSDSNVMEAVNKFIVKAVKVWTSKNPSSDYSQVLNLVINVAAVLYPYINVFSLISLLIVLFWTRNQSVYKYSRLIDNFTDYISLVDISERLKIRILKYYQESYSATIYNEIDIIDDVSSEIKDDIVLLKIAKVREEIAIFKMIPNEELILICTRLRKEVFFGNDVVGYCGLPNDRMFFIARGTIAFYTDEATEVLHFPVTTHFQWRGIDMQMLPTVANYLACETTVLYSLTRRDYSYIRSSCPIFVELLSFNSDHLIDVINFTKEKDLEEMKFEI